MLAAAWTLAIATAILALAVPVAWFTWLSGRRRDRDQQQREREEKARADFLKDASEKFVSRDTASSFGAVAVIAAVIGALLWFDGRKPKP